MADRSMAMQTSIMTGDPSRNALKTGIVILSEAKDQRSEESP